MNFKYTLAVIRLKKALRWLLVGLVGLSLGTVLSLSYLFLVARDVKFQSPIQPILRFETSETVKAPARLGFTK